MARTRSTKKPARRTPAKKPSRGAGKRGASRRPKAAKPSARPAARAVRAGRVTHTELASRDPAATKTWCAKVLGWRFGDPMPTPAGPYHMWSFGDQTGGGIRANNPPETPGSIPYCEVPDIKRAFDKALANGATTMMPPEEIPGGMGWIAIVQAPGGVPIGFWGPK